MRYKRVRTYQGGVISEKDSSERSALWRDFSVELVLAIAAVALGKLVKLGLDALKRFLLRDK